MLQKAIIVDLDGTLANIEHRVHFVRKNPKDWLNFNQNMNNDLINHWCFELIFAMSAQGYKVLFVTGRDDDFKNQTIDWLSKNKVFYEKLYMRKKGDYREDSEVKAEIYSSLIKDNYSVLFVVDDRKSVVEKWRELDLICLQCDIGDF